MESHERNGPKRVAFISTRISGSDGVSLEIDKWAAVLESMGHACYYIAGQCDDRPPERSWVIPEAHFRHPAIDEINRRAFGTRVRTPEISDRVREIAKAIKTQLREAISHFEIDVLIAENCVTIPMNIPLGIAVVETLMENPIACVAHHHDFVWERDRFLYNAVDDYLRTAFPPPIEQIQHVAINSQAAREFSRRTGLPCVVIPNVMDFDHSPPPPDTYCDRFRADLGIDDDDVLVLQPTRVVQRKGIETSIELIRVLGDPRFKLVITHSAGDEGAGYAQRIRDYAKLLGVEVILADRRIGAERGEDEQGRRIYTIWDAYQQADLVTYPSTYEGFGNAFLESLYYRKPILCNRYSIFRTDIEPLGFDVIELDGYLTEEVIAEVRRVVSDAAYRNRMVAHNFEIARHYFSYRRVATEMHTILSTPQLVTHGLPTSLDKG
ncbi:MAG: glycosyltransferase family 4 protein [Pseudomonadota bacterium]|nr:glycosyltransferase family 4 protein [Pseudomonadota bacterium]